MCTFDQVLALFKSPVSDETTNAINVDRNVGKCVCVVIVTGFMKLLQKNPLLKGNYKEAIQGFDAEQSDELKAIVVGLCDAHKSKSTSPYRFHQCVCQMKSKSLIFSENKGLCSAGPKCYFYSTSAVGPAAVGFTDAAAGPAADAAVGFTDAAAESDDDEMIGFCGGDVAAEFDHLVRRAVITDHPPVEDESVRRARLTEEAEQAFAEFSKYVQSAVEDSDLIGDYVAECENFVVE